MSGGCAAALAACLPESVTDARQQLGRGPADTLVLTVPIAEDTITPAEVVAEGRDTVAEGLAGSRLDPAAFTVLLAGLAVGDVDFEESTRVDPASVDFAELDDAIRAATLNASRARLGAHNTAVAPVDVTGTVGVVELDGDGNIPRDGLGNPVYQTDADGNAILVAIAAPGESALPVPAADSTVVVLEVSRLLDHSVHMVLDGRDAAFVAEGTVSLAGGSPTDIRLDDELRMALLPVVLLDLTIPDTGVVVRVNTLQNGLDFDSANAAQVVERLIRAAVTSHVVNQAPFGLEVDVAYAAGDRGDLTDIFALPDAVVLSRISVPRPTVDALGRATSATEATVAVEIAGEQVRALLGAEFTVGIRARLVPGSGGAGRGAVQGTDRIELVTRATIEVRTGGAP